MRLLALLGLARMTGRAHSSQILTVPEAAGVAAMRHDVVHLRRRDRQSLRETRSAARLLTQDISTQGLPGHGVVPAPRVPMRALLLLLSRARATATHPRR
jgi:hypothetical protein